MQKVKEADRLKGMDEEQILEAALKLPKDAQLRILEALLKDCETSAQDSEKQKAALVKLIKARKKAYLEGKTKTVSPEELIEKLREQSRARKQQSALH